MLIKRKEFKAIPAGIYVGSLEAITLEENKKKEPYLRWVWEICEGNFSGRKVSDITADEFSPKNNCGRMLQKVCGSMDADPEAFIGKKYQLLVAVTDNGFNEVTVVKAVDEEVDFLAEIK